MWKRKNRKIYGGRRGLTTFVLVFALLAGILWMPLYVSAEGGFRLESRKSVAVVYVCMELNDGEYGFGWGTGFFVGEQGEDPTYLITNYHVIADFVEYGSGELISGTIDGRQVQGRSKIRVYFDADSYVSAYLVSGDESKDIAVLKLETATSRRKPIALCSPTDELVGSTVYAVGYPGLADNVFAEPSSSWDVTDATVTGGMVNRIFTTEGTGRVNLQIDCVIRHGNSGGPLLNSNGAVVGVNTWGVSSSDGEADMYYAVSIDEAILLLNQNGVAYTMFDAAEKADEVADMNGGEEPDSIDREDYEPPYPGNSRMVVVIIMMAVVILAGIVVAIFFVARKNRQKSPQSNLPVSKKPDQQPLGTDLSLKHQHRIGGQGIQLVAVGGCMKGRTYPVGEKEITFGRDASATVCFPANTKGVSRQHCRIFWQNGTLMLMDTGSSYGTFIQAGKLQPMKPVPVQSGDVFYIGEKKNCFKIQ